MPKFKAVGYDRLSYTADRTVESDSIANQKKLIEDYVSSHPDIELVGFKEDDGYSGVLFDRPGFQEMMQEIMDGKVNCVIVKDDCVINTRKTICLKSSGFPLVFGSIPPFLNHNRKTHNIRTS